MFLYCVDEASNDPRGEFFVFGGITVQDYAIVSLVKAIDNIKKTCLGFSLPREVEIKWNFEKTKRIIKKATQKEITKEQHVLIKNAILSEVSKLGKDDLGITLYIVPYHFFTNDGWKSYQIAMNICFGKFEDYLTRKNSYGIVLIDELQGIKTKNTAGKSIDLSKDELRGHILFYILSLYESGTGKKTIPHIPLIIPNIISTLSGLHQINDLILGSFQYYLQYVFSTNGTRRLSISIVTKFIRNFHVNFESPDKIAALNCGISIYPQNIIGEWATKIPILKNALLDDYSII